MFAFHQRTIDRLGKRFTNDANAIGLVIVGSVARGEAHERSDVDTMGFTDWPQPPEGAMARFQRDREENWRTGVAPLADR